ncbi:MAG TPA: CBS domain-containing protein [Armatimonadaceae bacterium]|nr:CBS domain-containing protein [Armatimonadaceae bacterium]
MKVSEIMTPGPAVVKPEATLQEAAETMHAMDIGPLPVCDASGKLVGMLTDRDITVRATAEGRDPYTTYVRDVMTAGEVLFVYDDQNVEDAARVMEQNQVRRLAVLDRSRGLVGIVSLGDIALSGTDEDVTAEALEEISEPGRTTRP